MARLSYLHGTLCSYPTEIEFEQDQYVFAGGDGVAKKTFQSRDVFLGLAVRQDNIIAPTQVTVETKKRIGLRANGITLASLGEPIYLTHDFTPTLSQDTNVLLGSLIQVSDGMIWVDIEPLKEKVQEP